MSNVFELHQNEEKQFRLKVEMAVGMTVNNYIDKGRIARTYREELEKYLFSKVQGFARQFLECIAYSVPYNPTGDSEIDQKSKALASMTSERIGQMTMVMFAQSLTKVVELELELWISSKTHSELGDPERP